MTLLTGGKRCIRCAHLSSQHATPMDSDVPGEPHMACSVRSCDCDRCETWSDEPDVEIAALVQSRHDALAARDAARRETFLVREDLSRSEAAYRVAAKTCVDHEVALREARDALRTVEWVDVSDVGDVRCPSCKAVSAHPGAMHRDGCALALALKGAP